MRLALNCGSPDQRRTIYVYSDGNFNRGRWPRAWDAAAEASAAVHLVKLDKPMPPEVAATDLLLPPAVRVNQGFMPLPPRRCCLYRLSGVRFT